MFRSFFFNLKVYKTVANSFATSNNFKGVYERVANETLESLCERFDLLAEELGDSVPKEYDVSYSNGDLSVKLGDSNGTYVLNKQTPNLQIWLSSPVSGPKRFDFVDNKWIYKRTGESLNDLLSLEMTKCFGKKIHF